MVHLRRPFAWLVLGCLVGGTTSPLGAAEPAAPALHRVKLVPFRVEARVEGVFESPTMAEVRLDARRSGQFNVEKVVPHGTRVGKGDVLVAVETDRLDQEIADQEIAGRLAEIAHDLLE
jgi:hypothetical protein